MQDLDRMEGRASCAILDLMAAAGARSGDHGIRPRLTDRRKEHHLADLHREVVVPPFIAKRARHAAAARGNRLHRMARR